LLQRRIAKPLERLTMTARTIVATKNYRMRVEVENDDEIGWLAHTVNKIIEAVEKRDEELHRCNERLVSFEQKVDYPFDLLGLSSLHIADGIEHIGGSVEAYRKQLRRFREHFANTIQDLKNIVFNEKDMLSAGVYLNALKGVSGNIGAISLFHYVSHLANDLRKNRPLDKENLQRLEILLQEVFRDIDSLPLEKIPVSDVEKPPFSVTDLLTKTDELRATLENDLGESEKHLTQLCELASGSEFEALTEAIAGQLDEFNIEQASLLLEDLKQRLTLMNS
jgi:two-component system, sensor histidine kinase and response regulator